MNFFATIRSILLHDLGWKILSVVLAGIIWFTVHKNLVDESKMVAPSVPADAERQATNSLLHTK